MHPGYTSVPDRASFGARDTVVDVAEVDKLRTGLDRAGVPSDVKVYPEATRSFLAQYTGSLGMLMWGLDPGSWTR